LNGWFLRCSIDYAVVACGMHISDTCNTLVLQSKPCQSE
jgi:hypothetical protein